MGTLTVALSWYIAFFVYCVSCGITLCYIDDYNTFPYFWGKILFVEFFGGTPLTEEPWSKMISVNSIWNSVVTITTPDNRGI